MNWAEIFSVRKNNKYTRKFVENYIFKNLNEFDSSVLNSKNLNSKNCYETVQIHFQLEEKDDLKLPL